VQPEVVSFSVGQVAQLSGLTVRALHHYDEIGLLSPTERTPAGYRVYASADLARLRQILYYRELGFALDEIAAILAEADVASHLRRQHKLLRERIARLSAMVAALEKEMEAQHMGISLTPEEQFEIFGTDEAGGEWAQEAEQRWTDTDAYRQSARRTEAYGKAEWLAIKAEADARLRDFAEALRSGVPPDSTRAMDLAEAHRRHISQWFYECSYEVHRGLAEMYTADERFAKHYEDVAPGLAQYVHDAITANAGRAAT
jgi:DNA-binding transcriptional MerR regulator